MDYGGSVKGVVTIACPIRHIVTFPSKKKLSSKFITAFRARATEPGKKITKYNYIKINIISATVTTSADTIPLGFKFGGLCFLLL